jgi:hypothetical protein
MVMFPPIMEAIHNKNKDQQINDGVKFDFEGMRYYGRSEN